MTDEEKYDQILSAYYTCFTDSDAGRIVLADLQNRFYKRTFITEPPIDPTSILVNEGARSVVVYILSKIEELEMKYGRKIQ